MILHDLLLGGFNENTFVSNLTRETFYSIKVRGSPIFCSHLLPLTYSWTFIRERTSVYFQISWLGNVASRKLALMF